MKTKLTIGIFLYLLIYLSSVETMLAKASVNGSVILELEQTSPTPEKIATPTPQSKTDKRSETRHSILGLGIGSSYISYGFLVPGDPLIRSDSISIMSTEKMQYNLFISQDNPLQAENNTVIPDTTCDSGACNPTLAALWESPLTFGFGIRCENSPLCVQDFNRPGTFRPLAAESQNELPSRILSGSQQETQATIVYKLNISPNQAAVPYTHTVTYTLIPQL